MHKINIFIVPVILSSALISTILLLAGTASAAILPPPDKLSEHVYAWIGPYSGPNKENNGFRMNLGFVVGGKAIAVIDTGYTKDMAKEMIGHIRKISSLPIKYAINSNSQPHRFFGNDVFKKIGSEIIATKEGAARMKARAGDFASSIERLLELPKGSVSTPVGPSSQLSNTRQLDLGGKVKMTLTPAGANHTPNSIIVVIPGDLIVFASDILYSGRLLAVMPDSNVKSWIAAFESLNQYDAYTFIPGHGQPAKLSAFKFPTHQYLSTLYTYMKNAVDNDISIDDAMAKLDQSAFSKLENFKDLAGRNSSWAYLQAEQQAFE